MVAVKLTAAEQRRLIDGVRSDPQWSHMTPDDILGAAQSAFQKIARHMSEADHETTPEQAREMLHERRYAIYPELILRDAIAFFEFEEGSDEALLLKEQFELLGKDGFVEWLREMMKDDGDGEDES